MNGLTWFWPVVTLTVALSWLLAPPVARVLRTGHRVAWLLVFSLGLIVAAVVTPIDPPVGIDIAVQRPCDLSRHWFATFPEITAMTDVTLNIAVYIPIGVAVALLPVTFRSGVVVVSVIVLPPVIETLQFLAPVLARGCQSEDAFDSLTGLAIGLSCGVGVRLARLAWTRGRPAMPR